MIMPSHSAEDLGVSRETMDDLAIYSEMVKKWNPAINLVSKASVGDLFGRHIVDSLQLRSLAPPMVERWVDLGSGGGFPGLVVAIQAKHGAGIGEVVLVEADQRKSIFLTEVVRRLALPARIVRARIERADPLEADVLSARALAPLIDLCAFAKRHMKMNGVALFPKGERYAEEVDTAKQRWQFVVDVNPSKTEMSSAVLRLKEILYV